MHVIFRGLRNRSNPLSEKENSPFRLLFHVKKQSYQLMETRVLKPYLENLSGNQGIEGAWILSQQSAIDQIRDESLDRMWPGQRSFS